MDCAASGARGLGDLRTVLSTGSPLLPEHFQWVYEVRHGFINATRGRRGHVFFHVPPGSFSLIPPRHPPQEKAVKGDVHLASISGGTDILGCFALGNPTLPVRAGHLQCLGLGMDVCAYRGGGIGGDSAESSVTAVAESRVAPRGEMGELVCRCVAGEARGGRQREDGYAML